MRAGWSWTVFAKSYNGVREEGKFGSGHSTGRVSLLHAPITTQQAAGRIRAEGWVLGKEKGFGIK